MTAAWIVKAVAVFKDYHLSLTVGFPCVESDWFSLYCFEDRFDSSLIITIVLITHGELKVVLAHVLFMIVRPILASTVGVVGAVLRW